MDRRGNTKGKLAYKKVIDELMLSTSSFVLKVLFSHLSLLENRTEKEPPVHLAKIG